MRDAWSCVSTSGGDVSGTRGGDASGRSVVVGDEVEQSVLCDGVVVDGLVEEAVDLSGGGGVVGGEPEGEAGLQSCAVVKRVEDERAVEADGMDARCEGCVGTGADVGDAEEQDFAHVGVGERVVLAAGLQPAGDVELGDVEPAAVGVEEEHSQVEELHVF